MRHIRRVFTACVLFISLQIILVDSIDTLERCDKRRKRIFIPDIHGYVFATFPAGKPGENIYSMETCQLKNSKKRAPMVTLKCLVSESGASIQTTLTYKSADCVSFYDVKFNENSGTASVTTLATTIATSANIKNSDVPHKNISSTNNNSKLNKSIRNSSYDISITPTITTSPTSKTVATTSFFKTNVMETRTSITTKITTTTLTTTQDLTATSAPPTTSTTLAPTTTGKTATRSQEMYISWDLATIQDSFITSLQYKLFANKHRLDEIITMGKEKVSTNNLTMEEYKSITEVLQTEITAIEGDKMPASSTKDIIAIIEILTKKSEEIEASSANFSLETMNAKAKIVTALETFVQKIKIKESFNFETDDGEFDSEDSIKNSLFLDTDHFILFTGSRGDTNSSQEESREIELGANTTLEYNEEGVVFESNSAIDHFEPDENIYHDLHDHHKIYSETTFTVPWAVIYQVENMLNVRAKLSFVLYKNSYLFPSSTYKSNQVISVTLNNLSNVNDLAEPIKFSMETDHEIWDLKKEEITFLCGFWDTEVLDWSTDGCRMIEHFHELRRTECECDHLTNFAVLMDIHSKEDVAYSTFLDTLGTIGCSLSVIGLILTITVHLAFKQLRSRRPQIVLLNLSSVLLLAYIVFFFIDSMQNQIACVCVAAALHYLWLCVWFWMAVEGHTMFSMLVKVIKPSSDRYILRASLFAYGLPFLIVAVCLGISFSFQHLDKTRTHDTSWNNNDTRHGNHTYAKQTGAKRQEDTLSTSYTSNNVCWPDGVYLYYGFALPVAVVTLYNIVIFSMVLRVLTCGKTKITSTAKRRSAKELATIVISLTSLLGMTWIFGFLSMISKESSYRFYCQLLFSIFNSSQGIFIFLLFCVRHKQVRELCKQAFLRKLQGHSIPMTSTQQGEKMATHTGKRYQQNSSQGLQIKQQIVV